jgi:hypothetical protein
MVSTGLAGINLRAEFAPDSLNGCKPISWQLCHCCLTSRKLVEAAGNLYRRRQRGANGNRAVLESESAGWTGAERFDPERL